MGAALWPGVPRRLVAREQLIEDLARHAEIRGAELVERQLEVREYSGVCGVEQHRRRARRRDVEGDGGLAPLRLVDEEQVGPKFLGQADRLQFPRVEVVNR